METERKELDGRELHGREFDGNVCDDGRELYIDFVGTLPLYTRQLALRLNEASFIKISEDVEKFKGVIRSQC
jgi:hypothetical protein